jgi:hypothetical protein
VPGAREQHTRDDQRDRIDDDRGELRIGSQGLARRTRPGGDPGPKRRSARRRPVPLSSALAANKKATPIAVYPASSPAVNTPRVVLPEERHVPGFPCQQARLPDRQLDGVVRNERRSRDDRESKTYLPKQRGVAAPGS